MVVITGPTAVGKTQVSLALAESLNGDIISADSVQVYRGLDVGSDKVGHGHILCCNSSSDRVSLSCYAWQALAALDI